MVFLLLALNIFTPFSSVSVVDFEQVSVSWEVILCQCLPLFQCFPVNCGNCYGIATCIIPFYFSKIFDNILDAFVNAFHANIPLYFNLIQYNLTQYFAAAVMLKPAAIDLHCFGFYMTAIAE